MEQAVLETSSDRYVVQQYLAEGGMGAIYVGKRLDAAGAEKEVVIKQLLPEFTSEPRFIDLFLREARITAALDHPNIVRTFDLVTSGSDYFMVMEYVRGGDLRTLLRRARRRGKLLQPAAALAVGRAIVDALDYAHARRTRDGRPLGLIHRDVSPSNILVSGAGEVKLTDFGIAKAATQQSVLYRVKGKVGYMSPEQARGEKIDARSDLYSVAVCVYEALTGERLFVADMLSTPSMIYSQRVVPPSERRRSVPPEVDAVLLRALSVDPAARYQGAAELGDALEAAARRTGLACTQDEVAAHFVEACGHPSLWLHPHDLDEPATGTAPIDDEPAPRAPRTGLTVGEGTQLTSILRVSEAAAAVDDDDDEPADGHEPAPWEAPRPRGASASATAPDTDTATKHEPSPAAAAGRATDAVGGAHAGPGSPGGSVGARAARAPGAAATSGTAETPLPPPHPPTSDVVLPLSVATLRPIHEAVTAVAPRPAKRPLHDEETAVALDPGAASRAAAARPALHEAVTAIAIEPQRAPRDDEATIPRLPDVEPPKRSTRLPAVEQAERPTEPRFASAEHTERPPEPRFASAEHTERPPEPRAYAVEPTERPTVPRLGAVEPTERPTVPRLGAVDPTERPTQPRVPAVEPAARLDVPRAAAPGGVVTGRGPPPLPAPLRHLLDRAPPLPADERTAVTPLSVEQVRRALAARRAASPRRNVTLALLALAVVLIGVVVGILVVGADPVDEPPPGATAPR